VLLTGSHRGAGGGKFGSVLFMNRPFDMANPRLLDMAPTILAALGVPKADSMEGRSLLL
jgi:bisphosphoglycerate-independent phosphoglycerate mutase (AlkP superfamily)